MQSLINGQHSSATLIALLRHGKTIWNEAGRIQGHENSHLSMTGKQEVHGWGRFLAGISIDKIVASDLGRVKETVAILQQYREPLPVIWEPALREQNWGEWEGLTFKELQEKSGTFLEQQVRAGWDFCPPRGESRREVLQRVLPSVINLAKKYRNQRILMVCHEGVVKSLIYHLAGRAFLPEEKTLLQKRLLHLLIAANDKLSLGPLNIFPATTGKKR